VAWQNEVNLIIHLALNKSANISIKGMEPIMSQKFFSQHSEIVSAPRLPQINGRNLITIVALLIAIMVALSGLNNRPAASIGQTAVIPYGNALELQYAQPHLTSGAVGTTAVIPYGNALALQYASPYLNSGAMETAVTSDFSNALEMQYAQPYMNQDAGETASPLELQYAQPWLNK
jgi:hypothetical protein